MYKLSNENQAPIGDGYDVYMKSMELVVDQAKMLKALISYRSNEMIDRNKTLALVSIGNSIEALEELKEAMNNMDI
jgi:hypothetical protein